MQGIDIPTDVPDNDPGRRPAAAVAADRWRGGRRGRLGRRTVLRFAGGDRRWRRAGHGRRPAREPVDRRGPAALYSIPGAILAGGILLAAVGGTWLRKIGAIALGGARSPARPRQRLPDLRKASS